MNFIQRHQTRRSGRLTNALIKRSRRPYSQSVHVIGYPVEQKPERKFPRGYVALISILLAVAFLIHLFKG